MAEEFVSKDQFEEFTKRMEQGFDHVNQRFDQMNQRFDQMTVDMRQMNTDLRAEMRQMRNWLIGLYSIVVFGFISSIFLTIIKHSVTP